MLFDGTLRPIHLQLLMMSTASALRCIVSVGKYQIQWWQRAWAPFYYMGLKSRFSNNKIRFFAFSLIFFYEYNVFEKSVLNGAVFTLCPCYKLLTQGQLEQNPATWRAGEEKMDEWWMDAWVKRWIDGWMLGLFMRQWRGGIPPRLPLQHQSCESFVCDNISIHRRIKMCLSDH